jgi:tetratricopeptide (TPR) repeat protein
MSEAESGFATQSGSASVAALIELAGRLHFQRKYQEALRLITNCLNLAPRNAALWNFAGVCAAELDRHGQAERCWRRAISIDPTLPEVHFNLGLMFARTKRADEAELFYRREIALHPHFAQAHCNLGNLLDAANRSEEAQTCYRAAIESNPGFAAGHHNLGNLLMRQGRLIEAEQCYRRTIALAPSDVGALTNMGLCWRSAGKPPKPSNAIGAARHSSRNVSRRLPILVSC